MSSQKKAKTVRTKWNVANYKKFELANNFNENTLVFSIYQTLEAKPEILHLKTRFERGSKVSEVFRNFVPSRLVEEAYNKVKEENPGLLEESTPELLDAQIGPSPLASVIENKQHILSCNDRKKPLSVKFSIQNQSEDTWGSEPQLIDTGKHKICPPKVIDQLLEPGASTDVTVSFFVPEEIPASKYIEVTLRLQDPQTNNFFGDECSILILLDSKGFTMDQGFDINDFKTNLRAEQKQEAPADEEKEVMTRESIVENALNMVNFVDQ